MKKEVRILFVCLGNICRSPAAEGILKHLNDKNPALKIYVESCGIGDWHVGRGADSRMKETAALRGIKLDGKAQQFDNAFFYAFDLILASDREVQHFLHHYAQPDQKSKIHLMTEFSPTYHGQDVPDPYYGGAQGFDHVMDILEDSCVGLIEFLRSKK